MSMSNKALRGVTLSVLALLAFAGGCSKKIWITQMPDFYTPDLKTVAVASFRNQTQWQGAGEIMADKLAAALSANGSYNVYNRNDLKAVMDESDLQIALGADPTAAAEKLKNLTQVQAILVGTVTTYAATQNSQQKRDPVYNYDNKGNAYVAGYKTYTWTRNEGNVSVTMTLLRVSDGSTIASTPGPVWARVWAEGSPPAKDGYAVVTEAADNVTAQLVTVFAPVRMEIKVDPNKALRTATELYDNQWQYSDTFDADAETMYVVVSLPACCDRNNFRLAIVRKDGREDLAVQNITWDKQYGGFGYTFSPRQIAEKGGKGAYEVKFYSGPEPVMRHAFTIR